MSFVKSSTAAAPSTQSKDWKAEGFINFYVARKDGSRAKLGAFGLKANKEIEKIILEWLKQDPANVQKLASKLIIDFQLANKEAASDLDLE